MVWPVLPMYAVQHYASQLMCRSHRRVELGYVGVFDWSQFDWASRTLYFLNFPRAKKSVELN